MRIPFSAIAALTCAIGCGGVTNVDDLFDPSPTSGSGGAGGSSGLGGSSGKGGGGQTGGSGGVSTGGTGGTGGAGGIGGGVGGTGGVGGGGAGTGGSGGTGGTGGMVDSGADVRRDGTADARVDSSGKGGVRCGATTCEPAMGFCCLSASNPRCLMSTTTCSLQSHRLNCDDTADCPLGQLCCVTEGTSGNGAAAVCTASCAAPRQILCDPAALAPCLGALPGYVCSANGSGIIEDYAYCHAP
jgi:hypothetical protein